MTSKTQPASETEQGPGAAHSARERRSWRNHRGASEQLQECSRLLRDHVRRLQAEDGQRSPAAAWLIDNHSYLQFQIRETRRTLPPAYLRALPRIESGPAAAQLRIYRLAADLLAQSAEVLDAEAVAHLGDVLQADHSLMLGELWAFGSMLKLAIFEQLCGGLDLEPVVRRAVQSLRALEMVSWCDFVESVSHVESILRRDPGGIYARMDFPTRDRYRHLVEGLARRSALTEEQVAESARLRAERACRGNAEDYRERHVGFYLVGPGAEEFQRRIGYTPSLLLRMWRSAERWPSFFYVSAVSLLTALIVSAFAWLAGPFPLWLGALLLVPASQAAMEIVNALISRLLPPRELPSMDFSEGVPDDCATLVVVPTLLLSAANVARLLEDLEIRYLANRGPNLYFALLTDFADADRPETAGDAVLAAGVEGVRRLNARYAGGKRGPFYLFHRPRQWNPAESRWMGYERKRGKLNDLNRLLLGRGNRFETIIGDLSVLLKIRYVITLDTDTQLPRDTASKMIAAIAHPLNHAVLDSASRTVKEGYALLRPRVSVSMESSGRSRLAQIFSGQAGFDPYATAVSDVYQDLHGQASFIGKGIYDLWAFDAAVSDRFPENAILSHDLIEGEHARTGLLTSVELVEDYPASYRAFLKRKHRWVRGDWQLLPWLLPRTPVPGGGRVANPLSFLSRWKIFDNLRRSLLEISIFLLFVTGWFWASDALRWTLAMLALLQLSAYVDLMLTVVPAPERRFWPAFLHNLGERFLESQRNALLNLTLLPHQACIMLDAILRSSVRRFVTHRHLLEWETMAQSELSGGARIGIVEQYLYLCSAMSLLLIFVIPKANVFSVLVCALWAAAPLVARWLNQPLPNPAELSGSDRAFLRDVALRTWRFFSDHSDAGHHWLVPDNAQQEPVLVAHRVSPTNLGLLLTAHLAAHDFGYLRVGELTQALRRIFDSMNRMPGHRGHFFNWYDTRTLQPFEPHYVSTVDSGNLGASLCALRQGCLLLKSRPVLGQELLDGLRDHVLRLREEVPYARRTLTLMRLLSSLLRQLECRPADFFFWEAVLTEARDLVERLRTALAPAHAALENQQEHARSDELRYWEALLWDRLSAALAELYQVAPWLAPAFEPELRVNMCDPSLEPLLAELSRMPALEQLPDAFERIRDLLVERLVDSDTLYPALRSALRELLHRIPEARERALELLHGLDSVAGEAARFFEQMDFRFLFDSRRKLLRVGYDVTAKREDECCYDLLASEARSAVFLSIAKGDIPREAWFRLGRKLTAYREHRTLISWSGTMFEYLMPLLHMRNYGNTLLDCGMRGALAIQQVYARERDVPWGISEAAYAARDSHMQYQYRAFGISGLSARPDRCDSLVVAPYASMLALMLDPSAATANLRLLAAQGCLTRYGFFESIDYSAQGALGAPELIRSFMAHHQGMGMLAIDNALLGGRMQERFHLSPLVQATEFLLQERMPALVEVLRERAAAA